MISRTISHYRIISELGRGGMGVVYLAEDTVLGRQVAFKTLTEGGLGKQHYRTRFLREARAVSALSHPNIATIHDYGETNEGHPYIVMEYVKGKTLADLINECDLTIERSVEIIIDVAKALGEAHSYGIIHRDIKPSNIAINERGQVKVLDFGLAKQLMEPETDASDPDDQLLLNTQTREGQILGTPMYLSPEQAMGISVDSRSDLFSLGSVFYECISGTPAFSGVSPMDICAKVIREDPCPPSAVNNLVPIEFDRITLKTLAKKADDRFQSADDLISELRTAERYLEHFVGNGDARQSFAAIDSKKKGRFVNVGIKSPYTIALLSLIVLVLTGVVVSSYLLRRSQKVVRQFQQTRLAISGNIKEAVISPDGKYVASIIDEAGTQSLLLRQINTANELPILPPTPEVIKGLSFSPTGDYIYYLKKEGDSGDLYRISVLGGSPRKLISSVDTPVTFSPSGDKLAFIRASRDAHSTSLIIASSEGTDERIVVTLKDPQFFSRGGFYSSGPAWSPDGLVIAVPAYSMTDTTHRDVVAVTISDGSFKVINTQMWSRIENLAWLSDGSGLLMNASNQPSSPLQIWLLAFPKGSANRITLDPSNYFGLSTTKDSQTLLTTKVDSVTALWMLTPNTSLPARQVIGSKYIGAAGITWTRDGNLVYASNTTGAQNIWTMDPDGGKRRQLTFGDDVNAEPAVSPDNRYIVFIRYDARHPHLWRMDFDGGNEVQLTRAGDEDLPQFTHDGKWVIYHSINSDQYSVRRVAIEGGEPVVLTSEYATQPDVSPDGKSIVCFSRPSQNESWEITIIDFESGVPRKRFGLPLNVNPEWPGIRWSPDGLSVTYVATAQGVSNIWSLPFDGGIPKRLTDFTEGQIYYFAWARNTGELTFVHGSDIKDILLLRDFQ